jgi:hypothetical protein
MVSGIDNEGLPAIGPIVQTLGARLRRVFTNPSSASAEIAQQPELSRVVFFAGGAESRAKNSTDYTNTSERIAKDLRAARVELVEAVIRFEPTRISASRNVKKEQDTVLFTLARINTELGFYDAADSIYNDLYSGFPIDVGHSSHFASARGLESHEVDIILAYLEHIVSIISVQQVIISMLLWVWIVAHNLAEEHGH